MPIKGGESFFKKDVVNTYLIRRILLIIPTLVIVSIIVFSLVRFIPGDLIDMMLGQKFGGGLDQTEEQRKEIEKMLGLDVPAHVQYLRWVGGIFLRGDLGTSLISGLPIWETQIRPRIPVTAELTLMALIFSLLIAFPIGTYSAIRQDTLGDYAGRTFSIFFISIPEFWTATMIMIYLPLYFGWAPPMRYVSFLEDPGTNLLMFLFPGVVLGLALSGQVMRMIRTMMLEVLRSDYVRTAWSKGLRERVVVLRHVLKNALIPVVSLVGLQLPFLLGGAIITEQIFVLPCIGRLVVNSLQTRSYNIVTAVNLVIATAVLFINLLVDLSYAYLDPRIRYK